MRTLLVVLVALGMAGCEAKMNVYKPTPLLPPVEIGGNLVNFPVPNNGIGFWLQCNGDAEACSNNVFVGNSVILPSPVDKKVLRQLCQQGWDIPECSPKGLK